MGNVWWECADSCADKKIDTVFSSEELPSSTSLILSVLGLGEYVFDIGLSRAFGDRDGMGKGLNEGVGRIVEVQYTRETV